MKATDGIRDLPPPQWVEPEKIRLIWPQIEPMIEHSRARTGQRWITADVYARCVFAKAGLWIRRSAETGEIIGAIVLEKTASWGQDVMDVWVCVHKADDGFVVADYWPWLRETARAAGCDLVTFGGRRGHLRTFPGVKFIQTSMEVEV